MRLLVKTIGGTSEEFGSGMGAHQGCMLSPVLFVIVVEETTRRARRGVS